MSQTLVIDTHALVWYIANDPKLGVAARQAMDRNDNVWLIPSIVLMELMGLIENGKLKGVPFKQLIDDLAADPRVAIVPLTHHHLLLAKDYGGLGDQHDRCILAVAVERKALSGEDVKLVSRDSKLATNTVVQVLW